MKKRMMWCVAAAAAVMMVVSACASGLRQTKGAGKDIAYTVAQRYFLNGDVRMPASAKVDNEADFNRLFGMATVMGPDGQPTPAASPSSWHCPRPTVPPTSRSAS